MYCKRCNEQVTAIKETRLSTTSSVYKFKDRKCFFSYFSVSGDNLQVEVHNTLAPAGSKYELFYSNNQLFVGLFENREPLQCANYLDKYFETFDYCRQDIEQEKQEYNLLLASLENCIKESLKIANEDNNISSFESTINTVLETPLSAREGIVVNLNNSEGTQQIKSKGSSSENIIVHINVNQKTGQAEMTVRFSEEYLSKLNFSKKEAGLLEKLIMQLDDLVAKSKVQFCPENSLDKNCVDQSLRFLQVLTLNLESIAENGTIHEAMWNEKDKLGVRHLMPESYRWTGHMGGVVDAGGEEVLGVPIFIKTVGEILIFPEQREAIKKLFTAEGVNQILESAAKEIVDVIEEKDKRDYALTKASIQFALLFFNVTGGVSRNLDDVMGKLADAGKKLDDCPLLQTHYLRLLKNSEGNIEKVKILDNVLQNIEPKKLEEIVALVNKENLEDLLEDLSNSPIFRSAVVDNSKLVDSWKRAYDLFPSDSKFITDIPTLERITKLAVEGSIFRTRLGNNWSESLDNILKNASDLRCSNCGNAGRIGRSSIDQYLDDVEHFISNFAVNPGGKGEMFYNWMRGTTNPTSGQLDELHQTIRDFAKRGIKESEVEGLGKQFPIGTKKYDLRRVGDKYTEYKNKDFVNNPLTAGSDDVDQFINGYLKNVRNMDDLEWKAGFDKLKSPWGSEANALSNMKGQWKSVFESKADEIFEVIWDNQNLRNSLFGNLASSQTNSKALFNTLVKNTDDKIFKFVIVD